MDWTPLRGWAVIAGQYIVFTFENVGIFGKAAEVDLNDLLVKLI